MDAQYQPKSLEPAVQKEWADTKAFVAPDASPRPKYYNVGMLPYPSGKLHMGHVRNYSINDALCHFQRMKGCNVLQPMGWDAFGLPAENAAMANGVPPAQWTWDNIAYMKKQLQSLGFAIDWTREVATCSPDYYRWNQWLFLRMREKGIAYRKTGTVNWDPADQTVLANEQVIDGKGWRTGATVEKREIPMWYLRISQYADELVDALDGLGWPEQVKQMQRNWIGRSYGVEFTLPYADETARRMNDGGGPHLDGAGGNGGPHLDGAGRRQPGLKVYTTRADTIMGITFAAVAAEHPLAAEAAKGKPALAAFIEECKKGGVMEADLATMEKKGMPTGLFVLHPFTRKPVEVWVGNYVLMGYGEGAVMAVPGHDERDFAFAKKYGLAIRQVIDVEGQAYSTDAWQEWYEAPGVCVNSGKYDGLAQAAAIDAVAADLGAMGLGEKRKQFRLRDWGISRQRYWGTPIPMVLCPACGDVPVPDDQLPVVLPEDLVPDGSGSPLARSPAFYQCKCPSCGADARRETDTMDTFVDSSWYFFRYTCPGATAMVDGRADYWMPMDQYIGGIEHAILHLLYARFWTKVMRDMGLLRFDEPFTRLLTQGMVLNHSWFVRNDRGGIDYHPPADVTPVVGDDGRIAGGKLADGTSVEYGGVSKMSKSERNGVDPEDLIERYGADTARHFVMFASPPEATLEWSDAGVEGSYRFLKRLWAYAQGKLVVVRGCERVPAGTDAGEAAKAARREVHLALRQANYDYERVQYNTVVSAGYKMLNALDGLSVDAPGAEAVIREGLSILLRVLYPIVPHTAWALWRDLGYADEMGDLLDAPWPEVDERALAQDAIELVLQVNGKLRGRIVVPATADRAAIEAAARASDEVAKHAGGAPVKKVIVVPGRLVNVVV